MAEPSAAEVVAVDRHQLDQLKEVLRRLAKENDEVQETLHRISHQEQTTRAHVLDHLYPQALASMEMTESEMREAAEHEQQGDTYHYNRDTAVNRLQDKVEPLLHRLKDFQSRYRESETKARVSRDATLQARR